MTQRSDMRVGQHERVVSVSGEDAVTIRLLEMGLTPGVAFSLPGKRHWVNRSNWSCAGIG